MATAMARDSPVGSMAVALFAAVGRAVAVATAAAGVTSRGEGAVVAVDRVSDRWLTRGAATDNPNRSSSAPGACKSRATPLINNKNKTIPIHNPVRRKRVVRLSWAGGCVVEAPVVCRPSLRLVLRLSKSASCISRTLA